MFINPLTVATALYELTTQRAMSSVRSVAARALEPKTLTISHEVTTTGRVNSVIILSDSKLVTASGGSCPTSKLSDVSTTFRIKYSKTDGRADIRAALLQQRDELIELLTDANIDKLLNKES